MNTVILMGRLTKEPEPNVTQSGIQILRFTLAVDRPKKKIRTQKRISSAVSHSGRWLK